MPEPILLLMSDHGAEYCKSVINHFTYDIPTSVAEYIAMRHRGNSANELLEQPVIRALLNGVTGDRCLDLGCG